MRLTTIAASLISAGLATLITAKVVEDKMLADFDERLQEELAKSVTYLEDKKIAEPTDEYQEHRFEVYGSQVPLTKPPVEEVVNKNQRIRYDKVIQNSGYSPEVKETEKPEGEIEEIPLPEIHAITADEFLSNESGYLQSTITYFADGVVLDEEADPVDSHVDLIGATVPPFGELSGEPHIVYLRNNKVRREFEVVREEESGAAILADRGTAP